MYQSPNSVDLGKYICILSLTTQSVQSTQNQGCHVGSIVHRLRGVNAASTSSVTPRWTDGGGSTAFSSWRFTGKEQSIQKRVEMDVVMLPQIFLMVWTMHGILVIVICYLFRVELRGYSANPIYNVFDVSGDFLFEVDGVHTASPSDHWGNRHSKGSSPRPRQ